jgi:DNA-binding MarR family transcriptional regulator
MITSADGPAGATGRPANANMKAGARRRIEEPPYPPGVSDRFEPPSRARRPTTFPILLLRRSILLLSSVGARAGRLIEETLASIGIDSREYAVLAFLASAEEPVPQRVIAIRLGRDRTTVMELVRDLESKGLVARRRLPTDGRVSAVRLTKRGTEAFRSAESNLEAAELELFGELSPSQEQQLLRSLQRLL